MEAREMDDKDMIDKQALLELMTPEKSTNPDTNANYPEFSDHISVLRLPLIGRIHFVRDIKGFIQMSFIIFYWFYGSTVTFYIILWPQYQEDNLSIVFLLIYGFISAMTIISLFRASTLNPGRVPLNPGRDCSDYNSWEVCQVCKRRRPLRAHHCRRCKQCVLKMDHHCPWINNCVGEANQYAFLQLLLYAVLLSGVTFILDILHFYVYPPCTLCDTESFFIAHSTGLIVASTVMACHMGFAMSVLFCFQSVMLAFKSIFIHHSTGFIVSCVVMSVLMGLATFALFGTQTILLVINRTTIENMKDPPNPHKLKVQRTIWQGYGDTCGPGPVWLWFFPCRRRRTAPVYTYHDYV